MTNSQTAGGSYVRQEDGSLKLVQRTEASDQAKAVRPDINEPAGPASGKPGASKGK